MNYTKQQRLAMAAEFRRARETLKRGERFICYAIAPKPLEARGVALQCLRLVEHRLAGDYTATSWLARRGIPPHQLTDDNMRLYRLRWLDALIAEFSA